MSTLAIKLGVAFGMVAAIASFFPIFMFLMGDCISEQCGEHEGFLILGVFLLSCIVGVVTAWAVARVSRIMVSHGR